MSFCVRLGPDVDGRRVGGKARSLLRLAAAGLVVPPASVVTSDLFAAMRTGGPPLPATSPGYRTPERGTLAAIEAVSAALAARAWPPGFVEELSRALEDLARSPSARFSVRSSAAVEDQVGALAAGLFLSRLGVARDAVPEALRAVLASAVAPGAVVYLGQRGLTIDRLGFSVLIHPFVAGDAAGTAVFDPSWSTTNIDTHRGNGQAVRAPLETALRRLADLNGAVEVEWVATGDRPIFLQLRPYRSAPRADRAGGGDPDGAWRWDAAHNPLPLSPAQAGLVALVDARCRTAFRQRVTDGYLFYTDDLRLPAGTPSGDATGDAFDRLKALSERLDRSATSLEQALETFVAIYGPLFGVIQPAARAAKAALRGFLEEHGVDPTPVFQRLATIVPSAAGERRRLAKAVVSAPNAAARALAVGAYLELFGDESPAWDVQAPTWREDREALERRLRAGRPTVEPGDERRRDGADAQPIAAAPPPIDPIDLADRALPPGARDEWTRLLAGARRAVASGEDDDALYARAQAHLRRALLGQGARLHADGRLDRADQIFWLPLDLIRATARGEIAPSRIELAELIEAAQTADRVARARPPALSRVKSAGDASDLIRGRAGSGGAFIGRVRLGLGSGMDQPDGGGDVLVAPTILPTELPLVDAAALVIETGGPLDHVAAQARERGIAAVVGAVGACARLRDGDRVLVDGDAGTVIRLGDAD